LPQGGAIAEGLRAGRQEAQFTTGDKPCVCMGRASDPVGVGYYLLWKTFHFLWNDGS